MNQLVSLAVFPLLFISPSHCFSATTSPIEEAYWISIAGTRGIHIGWGGKLFLLARWYLPITRTELQPCNYWPLDLTGRPNTPDADAVVSLRWLWKQLAYCLWVHTRSQQVTEWRVLLTLQYIENINCNLTFGKWQKVPSRFWENILWWPISEPQAAQSKLQFDYRVFGRLIGKLVV